MRLNPLGCCLMPNVMEILVRELACYLLTRGGISAVFFGCSRSDNLQAGEEGGKQGFGLSPINTSQCRCCQQYPSHIPAVQLVYSTAVSAVRTFSFPSEVSTVNWCVYVCGPNKQQHHRHFGLDGSLSVVLGHFYRGGGK